MKGKFCAGYLCLCSPASRPGSARVGRVAKPQASPTLRVTSALHFRAQTALARRLRETPMNNKNVIREGLARCIFEIMQHNQRNSPLQHLSNQANELSTMLVQALAIAPADQVRGWISHRLRTSQKPDRRPVEAISSDQLRTQLADVKRVRNLSRKAVYSQSKLDPYKLEIEMLKSQGASLCEIRDWLRRYRRIHINKSTISRNLKRWRGENGQNS